MPAGRLIFGAGLLLMMAVLGISLLEIVIFTEALNLQLSDLEEKPGGA